MTNLGGIKKHGLIILPMNEVLGVCRKHTVSSSVCTDTCSTRNFFALTLAHGCITMGRCVAYNNDSRMTLSLTSKSNLNMASCPTRNFRLLWHWNNMFWPQFFWHTIFGAWFYHHEKICCIHHRSQYNVYIWIFVFLKIFLPLANFSLIWRHHHYR